MLLLSLAACAGPQGKREIPRSGDVSRPTNLYDLMLSVQETPAYRETGAKACIRQAKAGNVLKEFLPVIAAMLDAPPEKAGKTFCRALVEAAVAGDFSEADIRAMYLARQQRDFRTFGRFLRALLVANERLGAQQAAATPSLTGSAGLRN
ncbi:hypothetical protein [Pelagibius marinus]|uniref:hypothetical protein n=1 Tax=Pelagibius marinus TaxID=2762760 RepID=UPI001872EA9A|nr:hypothetical protein [Pelagibius marinus]